MSGLTEFLHRHGRPTAAAAIVLCAMITAWGIGWVTAPI